MPISADYSAALVRWVLPDDAKAVTGSMYGAMWPSEMKADAFVVPLVKNNRSVWEYYVYLSDGWWTGGYPEEAALPAGEIHRLEQATAKLRALLGGETEVRPVIFVPSGLAFAVGDNQGREAAVYIGWSDVGPGVYDFTDEIPDPKKSFPRQGQLFTPAQLKELLTP